MVSVLFVIGICHGKRPQKAKDMLEPLLLKNVKEY